MLFYISMSKTGTRVQVLFEKRNLTQRKLKSTRVPVYLS